MELEVKNAEKVKIQSSEDTYEIMRKIFFERDGEVEILKEHFWTIALNGGLKILCIELVSIGSNKRTIAAPQEIFRLPLYKSASQVVLIHNHPSGTLKPSEADIDLTNKLIQAGLLFDIKVVDHVIVTKHSYYSFCDNGLIEKLRWDNKYALTFIREKQIKEEVEKIKKEAEKEKKLKLKEGIILGKEEGKTEGAKAKEKQIARQMLKKGMDTKLVQELTGLTHQWLGRLKSEIEEESRKK
jgi:DNA repair protein RadC